MANGIFDKFKNLIGIEDIEDDDAAELEDEQTSYPKDNRKLIEPRSPSVSARPETRDARDNRVVSMQNQGKGQMKLIVTEPKGFEECPRMVDSLKGKKPVIINLEKLDPDVARKIFDFLSGAAYALDGNVQKIANNIFVFAPENVDVLAQIDNRGVDFRDGIKNPWK